MKNITNYETKWILPVLIGSLLLIAGILMAVYKREALQYILMFVGAVIIVVTVVDVALKHQDGQPISIIGAIIAIALGLILLILPGLVTDVLMVLLALALALYGILMIFRGAWVAGGSKTQNILSVIIGAICLALGAYALLNLHETADIVMILIGVMLAIVGALEVVRGLRMYREYA